MNESDAMVKNDRFEQIAAASRAMFWEINAAGLYTYASQASEWLLGCAPEDVVRHKHFHDFFQAEVRDILQAELQAIMSQKNPFNDFVYSVCIGKERFRLLSSYGFPVRDRQGNLAGYRGCTEDVTEIKKLQEGLFRMDRLRNMGVLASSLAHEINQPLAGIMSNTQAALRMLDSKHVSRRKIAEPLCSVIEDCRRAAAIMHRARARLKAPAGHPEPLEVNSLIRHYFNMLWRDRMARDVRLVLHLAEHLPLVRADKVQVEQVLANLVINAIQAMQPCKKKNCILEVATVQEGRRAVKITFRDNGPGVPSARLPFVFDALHSTKPGGLGMGLPICRSIIEAHGGRIWAENNKSGGGWWGNVLCYFTGGRRALK